MFILRLIIFIGMIGTLFVTSGTVSNFLASNIAAIARGSDIARQHCTRCHVVPDINPYVGIGSTPSFSAMKWLEGWAR